MRRCIAALFCLLLGGLLPDGLLAANVPVELPPFKSLDTPLPYRTRWGPYFVSVEATGEDRRIASRLRISDHTGRLLKEIRAYYIETVDYPDLDGRDDGEQLRVITAPDNNLLAERRTYCFTRRGKLRNILVMPGGIDQLRDLDGDNQPELLSDNEAPLEYAGSEGGDLCHAAYPPVYMILRWSGGRYTLANRRFPAMVLAQLAEKKRVFLEDIQVFQNPRVDSFSWDYLVGESVGIYADMASLGQRNPVRRWLLARLPSAFVREQFLAILPDVEERLAKLPAQVTTSQRRIINAPKY